MNRTTSGDAKGKAERQQTILRLIQEHPISRQEVLLEHLLCCHAGYHLPGYPGALPGQSSHQ